MEGHVAQCCSERLEFNVIYIHIMKTQAHKMRWVCNI